MKTASQAGWSLTHTESSSGFQFVTARDEHGNYAEFSLDVGTKEIVPAHRANTVAFFDLPLSVCNLIRFWFGTITWTEYNRSLKSL